MLAGKARGGGRWRGRNWRGPRRFWPDEGAGAGGGGSGNLMGVEGAAAADASAAAPTPPAGTLLLLGRFTVSKVWNTIRYSISNRYIGRTASR